VRRHEERTLHRLPCLLLLVIGVTSAADAIGPSALGQAWPGGDPAVPPGSDFFLFANGGWLKANPIPVDRAGFSNATVLTLSAAAKVRALLEAAAANAGEEPADEAGKVGAYYAAFMDQQRVEARGAAPLRRALREIRRARSRHELARLMGLANSTFHGSLFKLWIEPDSRNPDSYAIYLGQDGLGSLDRRVYLAPDAADLRLAYRNYMVRLLAAAAWENAAAIAAAVMAFETRLAAARWTAADERDESKIYNPRDVSQLASEAPGVHVDGRLTLGENIADIGGLQLAFAAYHASLHGRPAPVIDGLTGDQRFFLGFAELRRGHRRPQALRNDVTSDAHTPDACRVNEDVRNVDGWYEAFGVTPESALFMLPASRIHIW
jgi:predicted metalloendopeptidase